MADQGKIDGEIGGRTGGRTGEPTGREPDPGRDPDRLGRLGGRGGRGGREANVTGSIARRVGRGGSGGRGSGGGRGRIPGGRGTTPVGGGRMLQRVVVKVHHSRHVPGRAAGLLRAHVRYLGRESAGAEAGADAPRDASVDAAQRDAETPGLVPPSAEGGRFYDADRDGVDAGETVRGWASDRHHFRLIISPEAGRDLPDPPGLPGYVRELMRRAGRDLGTRLEWVAADHRDTDHPHAHVMVRGRRDDGRDLVIARAYVAHGLRQRARELATELLGERTAEQAARALRAEVSAERFTSLDRHLERRVDGRTAGGGLRLAPGERLGFTAAEHDAVLRRLEYLAAAGLARRTRGVWRLEAGWADRLRDLGRRNDVVRSLRHTLGADAARVQRAHADGSHRRVAGVVVDRGAAGDFGEGRYVVVRDASGGLHYGRVRDDAAYRAAAPGAVVELGRAAAADRRFADAAASADAAARTPAVDRRLQRLSRYEGSGVNAGADGAVKVDARRLREFLLGPPGSGRTDVTIVAPRSLEEQSTARAWTWLDRQTYRRERAYRDGRPWAPPVDAAAFEAAADARRRWLVGHGYARRRGDRFTLRAGAAKRLAREELADLAASLKPQGVASVSVVPPGAEARGAYAGTYFLHAGLYVAVRDGDRLLLAPTRRPPSLEVGAPARLLSDGRGAVRPPRGGEGRSR